jgi:hypothetical protein
MWISPTLTRTGSHPESPTDRSPAREVGPVLHFGAPMPLSLESPAVRDVASALGLELRGADQGVREGGSAGSGAGRQPGGSPPGSSGLRQYPSTSSPGTRWNSRTFRVTRAISWARAVAAIQRSLAPMRRPLVLR